MENFRNATAAEYSEIPATNRNLRYYVYRQWTAWTYGYLGRNQRRTVPACVVRKLRERFPEKDGNYVPFKECGT
jgi:hypothetical protein